MGSYDLWAATLYGAAFAVLILILCIPFSYAVCDSTLGIEIEGDGLVSEGTIRHRPLLSGTIKNYTIDYWVESIEGGIIRSEKNTTNKNWKSFTPSANDIEKAGMIGIGISNNTSKDSLEKSGNTLTNGYSLFVIRMRLVSEGCELESSRLIVYKTGGENGSDNDESSDGTKSSDQGINCLELFLDHAPESMIAGESFNIIASIKNRCGSDQRAAVMSYVYRASKIYSSSRGHNAIELVVPASSVRQVILEEFSPIEPGEYSIKLLIDASGGYSDAALIISDKDYLSDSATDSAKTKQITAKLNSIGAKGLGAVSISSFYVQSQKKVNGTASNPSIKSVVTQKKIAVAIIKNTLSNPLEVDAKLDTDSSFSTLTLRLGPLSETKVEYPLDLHEGRNHVFLTLRQNGTLIGMSELIVEENAYQSSSKGTNIYSSNSFLSQFKISGILEGQESKTITSGGAGNYILIGLMALSLLLNISFITKKKEKKDPNKG